MAGERQPDELIKDPQGSTNTCAGLLTWITMHIITISSRQAGCQQCVPSDKGRSIAHWHTACTPFISLMQAGKNEGKWYSWACCADEIWPSSVSVAPLSHRGSIASPVKLLLLMMSQWGLFVIWYYTPPLTHLPFTFQTSIFPWPSPPPSHTGQPRLRTLHNQCLELKKKKVRVWRPPNHHPLTHLPCAFNASLQPGLFALEAADWESIAALACCWQGQQTRTSRPIKIIQQPSLIYLFLSLYFHLAVKPEMDNTRHEPFFYPHKYYRFAELLSQLDVWDFKFFYEQWPLWRIIVFPALSDVCWGQRVGQVA